MLAKQIVHFFVRSLNENLGGGSHHNAISFIRLLRETGYEVIVHTLVSFDNHPPKDIQLIEHQGNSLGFIQAQDFLVELLNENEDSANLFFLYGVDFTWGGGKYRMHGGKVPVVVYLDTYLGAMGLSEKQGRLYHVKRALWDRFVGLRYAKYVNRFFAVSPFLQCQYIHFGFSRDKFSVVPNFFNLDTRCSNISVDEDGLVHLLYTGRIIYDKGVDILIRVVAKLPERYKWNLRIVGDGPMKEKCIRLTQSLGMVQNIEFVPWLDSVRLAEEYAKADVFVHPARWPEPFGRTIVEAMGNELAVIIPTRGGTSWIVGDAGISFDNGSFDSLYSAIERIVSNSTLRTSLKSYSKRRAYEFSKEHAGALLVDAVKEIIRE